MYNEEKRVISIPENMEDIDKEALSHAIKCLGGQIKDEMEKLHLERILLPDDKLIHTRSGETSWKEYHRLVLAVPVNKKFRQERILGEFDEGVADSGGDDGMLHHDPDHRKYVLSVEDALFILRHRDLIEKKLQERANMFNRKIEECF